MSERKVGRAPDFTLACVVMFGVNLIWILLTILALYGLGVVLLVGLAINHWINWIEARRTERSSYK